MKNSRNVPSLTKALIGKLTDRITYILWRSCAYLPLSINHQLGTLAGKIAYYTLPRRRRIALANLTVCLSDISSRNLRNIAKKSFCETGKLIFELPHFWHRGPQYVHSLCKQVAGQHIVDEAQAKGPIIYASLHLGCWEAFASMKQSKEPLLCLYRPGKMPSLNRLIADGRRTLNIQPLPANMQNIYKLFRALRAGNNIAVLGDLATRSLGKEMYVPFFGQPACTGALLPHLAKHATVVFFVVERLTDGYRVTYSAAPKALYDDDLIVSATAMNQALEKIILRCPKQYLWIYKRFSRSPTAHIYR